MKVSCKWLQEYVDLPADTQAFCDKLDLTGTGVEGVEEGGAAFNKVVVGQIVEKEKHPDSDHMWVCSVDVGEHQLGEDGKPRPLQIVCGAQNFEAGDKVAVALVGAELPGDIKIKKSKLRGITSFGMNCSSVELGLGEESDGIMILPEDAPIGMDFAQYKGLSDRILDLEITPNRPDCLSIEGMAREVGAMYKRNVKDVCSDFELAEGETPTADKADIVIEDAERCPRYSLRVIEGVKIGPSPAWLAERVSASGARSINNVVDATNYVMFLLGQPLHAFDFDKVVALSGEGAGAHAASDGKAHIVVRPAADGEKFTTLDEIERELTSDMTVIATPNSAIALAGVMGGLETEVTDETTSILLECATFSPGHTSRTSRNLGLFSESSMRYERQVNAASIARNADYAAALIADVAGGTVCKGLIDEYPTPVSPRELEFRIPRFCAHVGENIPAREVVDNLQRLGCAVEPGLDTAQDSDTLKVTAPTFRPDLEREIDLYEEVLRLYGMENIPSTLPAGAGRLGVRSDEEQIIAKLHLTLRASGLNETQTYAFANPQDMEDARMASVVAGEAVELINPLNAEQSVMRQSLIPGLLRSVAYNQNHGVDNIALYEFGNVFAAAEGRKQPKESQKLAGVLSGSLGDATWNKAGVPVDFFDGKGVFENIVRELGIQKVKYQEVSEQEAPQLQPGRAARIIAGSAQIGWLGEMHPRVVAAFDAKGPIVAFELDLNALVTCTHFERETEEISEFPPVSLDVAFVVDESVSNETLVQRMESAGGKLLSSVRLFDVFRDDERLGAGKKSMAYALEYRAADRTLTSEEADKAHERLIKKVCGATGAEVRS